MRYGEPVVYVPERGDVVWLSFTPQAGHEQAGRRPALVLSPIAYNRKVGLAILCPVTTQEKGYPFEVRLPKECNVTGVILADQVKSLDWRARKAEKMDQVPTATVAEVLRKLSLLLPASIEETEEDEEQGAE
ncbi:MAG: endoribonuclease MazF [Chloroflexota bacterium]|nr:endoribonuclease MazF [Chloroflexota bacterium]